MAVLQPPPQLQYCMHLSGFSIKIYTLKNTYTHALVRSTDNISMGLINNKPDALAVS